MITTSRGPITLYPVADLPMSVGRVRHYPSDTTDAEWALIEPLLPVPACQTPIGGRPEKHPRRVIVDAIRYVADDGGKWRALPRGLSAVADRARVLHPLGQSRCGGTGS